MDFDVLCRLIDSKVEFNTPDGSFQGLLKLVLIKNQRVTFEHVYQIPSHAYLGTMHVLTCDLNSCKIVQPAKEILDVSKLDSKEYLDVGVQASTKIDKASIIEIPAGKCFFDYLPSYLQSKVPGDFCVVDCLSATFRRAIDHLSKLSIIGVSFHGVDIFRNGSLFWIAMSSPECVFMFDIKQLNVKAFEEGLKQILENTMILKVIHDCRNISDCLLHKFNVNLQNVFDTQVADFLINMQMYTGEKIFRCVSSLDSCLVKYLKVPQQFLYNRNKCVSLFNEIKFFQIRPISDEYRDVILKSVMYLPLLKEVQENLLLHPFERAVELYLDVVRSATDSQVYFQSKEFTPVAPDYLIERIKSIRFEDKLENLHSDYLIDNVEASHEQNTPQRSSNSSKKVSQQSNSHKKIIL